MLKKIKTLPVILRLAAAVLAIVAFCLMFATQLTYTSQVAGYTKTVALPIFANDSGYVTVGGVIVGYILILVGGLVAAVSAFVINNKKIDMIVVAAGVVMAIVGAIVVFSVQNLFISANEAGGGGSAFGGLVSGEYKIGVGAVIGGILAIVSALANAGSVVLGLKK